MVFLQGIRDLLRWVLLKKASADLQQSLHASTFSTLRAKMQAALLDFGKASGMIGSGHSMESSQPFQSLFAYLSWKPKIVSLASPYFGATAMF